MMPIDTSYPAPSLPFLTALLIIVATVPVLVHVWRRLTSAQGRFLAGAIWVRLCADALQSHTASPVALGMSWNALISLAIVLCGFWVVRPALLRRPMFVPLFLYAGVGVLGGLYAGAMGGAFDFVARLAMLAVVMLAAEEALEVQGADFYAALMPAFLPLFLFQLVSVLFDSPKVENLDGSLSFIGGYLSKSIFSFAAMGAMYVAFSAETMRRTARLVWLLLCLVSLVYANYRTTLGACVPMMAVGTTLFLLKSVQRFQKSVVAFGGFVVIGLALAALSPQIQQRFASGRPAQAGLGTLIGQAPAEFSPDERTVMTGRVYIWSLYLNGWREASGVQRMIGLGPGSSPDDYPRSAHNSFISALYETGVVGLLAFVAMLAAFSAQLRRVARPDRLFLVAGHISFFILHFGTLPIWNVEGILTYGLIMGATLHSIDRRRRMRDDDHFPPPQASRLAPPPELPLTMR